MFGRMVSARPPFPYTFPIDFTAEDTAQVFDDIEETYHEATQVIRQHAHHIDIFWFISTPIFPADGIAPTTASTQAVIQEGTSSSKAVLTDSPVSKVVIRG